jgi:L-fucose isomerase-like protein
LKQDGGKGTILQADAAGIFDEETLGDIVAVSQSMKALHASRIGVVGEPSDWLIASHHDSKIVQDAWGPELKDIPFEELLEIIEGIRSKPEKDINLQVEREAEFFSEANEADMRNRWKFCMRLNPGLPARLSALTLRCFDLVLRDHSTGCLALSALADEGVDAGCEGDIPSIIGLHWVRTLTGQTGWMANPFENHGSKEDDRAEMLIAHCTAPRSVLSRMATQSFRVWPRCGDRGDISLRR